MSSEPPSHTSNTYPKAEVEYHEIAQNLDLFWEKVIIFHEYLGTKFKVPTIGGKSVDLHRLFVEVTSRGGIEKAIRDRRWREVTAAFKFPSSLTSGSFALRKCYLSLLYHFEQVYYFRREEPPSSVADAYSLSENTNGSAAPQASEDADAVDQHSEGLNLEEGSTVTGTIDAKFDYGYISTVNLGSEKLNGVLYHMPMPTNMSQALVPVSSTRRRKRRRKSAVEDPSRPKRNRSGYTFFFGEQYPRMKPLYHGDDKKSITKEIAARWNRLSAAEKQVYKEIGMRDKERYKAELSEYKSLHNPEGQ
ncbi:hypothetical protein LIER_32981 [Lithospermum erythrorhizon]|uniref:High mobility group B protein 10 n=1 Tax=Lithospermum erythrorhizon TaxID=34254 RepID=A0AAV3RX42_LITER